MKERFDTLVEHLLAGNIFLEEAIEVLEQSMIRLALQRVKGNQCAAAKQLGIHRNTLLAKIRKYAVENGRKARRKPAARAAPARKRKASAA
jgi:Fis family transcriptional regulator, factor for inversion stimulation protein